MITGKTIALTIQNFVRKVISLFSNMLSRFVIAFLPRSKCLLISWLQSPSAVGNNIYHCFHFFPFYLPWSDGTRCHELGFLNFEFQAIFFTLLFIKTLFSSSSLSANRVVSSANLRLLILLLAILIPACDSSSLAFHMIHCVCVFYHNLKHNLKLIYADVLMTDNQKLICLKF